MAQRVHVGIAMPQFLWPRTDLPDLRAFLARAEALGFDSAWVQEEILGEHWSLEPITLLAYAAGVTRWLRLGVAVLVSPFHSPVWLAKSLASLDHLTDGRLDVGIGLGGSTRDYPAFGITPERRVARFTEALEIMRRLWTEERVTFDGQFWKLEDAAIAPKAAQRPHPPVWMGGRHPRALRRAARLGDGFFGAGAASIEEFAQQVALVRGYAVEAGRDPGRFPIAKRVYVVIEPNRRSGLLRLREWFARYYGDPDLAERTALVGSVSECLAGLRRIVAAGAGLVLLNFVFDELESMELAARELLPALRTSGD